MLAIDVKALIIFGRTNDEIIAFDLYLAWSLFTGNINLRTFLIKSNCLIRTYVHV